MLAMGSRAGARSVFVITKVVVLLAVPPGCPSFTVHWIVYVPASPKPGAKSIVALVGDGFTIVENVPNGGTPVAVIVRISPGSPSDAVAVTEKVVPSAPDTADGAEITG